MVNVEGTVLVFVQGFALEAAIGSRACSYGLGHVSFLMCFFSHVFFSHGLEHQLPYYRRCELGCSAEEIGWQWHGC